jgi:hypothetical protein
MIYMVEMQFTNTAREHDWHTWYLAHTTQLVRNVPGFRATQRFRALTETASPWLALHDVAGPEVFESAAYKANGGPASTGIWQKEHTNWYRNLFGGIEHTPDVGADAHLLLAEEGGSLPPRIAGALTWLDSAGLDRTARQRGFAVLPHGQLTAQHFGVPGLRVFKPITPRIAGG